MKVLQIVDGFVYYDLTGTIGSLDHAKECFPEDVCIVEAPNNVFVGWGYDPSQRGDDRFIKPTPPEGFLYDEDTGTFYPEDSDPNPPSQEEINTANIVYLSMMTGVELPSTYDLGGKA